MTTQKTTRRHALHLLAAAGRRGRPACTGSIARQNPHGSLERPNCGCCKDWIVLMEQAGFSVKVHDTGNTAVRAKLGLPAQYGSCHTALVGGYVVEGHVPAARRAQAAQRQAQGAGHYRARHADWQPRHGWPRIRRPQRPVRRAAGEQNLMGNNVNARVFTSYR